MALAAASAPSVFERWPRFAMQLFATHSERRANIESTGRRRVGIHWARQKVEKGVDGEERLVPSGLTRRPRASLW